MDSNAPGQPEGLHPVAGMFRCLLNQRPHRQAIHEATWPFSFELNTIPQPGQNDRSSLSQSCWDINQLRIAIFSAVTAREHPLVFEWGIPGGIRKVLVESRTQLWTPRARNNVCLSTNQISECSMFPDRSAQRPRERSRCRPRDG